MTLAWFSNYAKQKVTAPCKTFLINNLFLVYCTLTYYFLISDMKGIHLSVETYFRKKYNESWEREIIQQEPDPIDIFAYEEKNINSLVKKPILNHLQR